MIRKAKLSEVAMLFDLIKIGSERGKVLVRTIEDISSNINNFILWLEKGKIVGCCSLEVYSQKLAEIRSLVVLPEYQKQGIGGKLIQRCLVNARKLGVYQILAVTDRHKLFKMAGFTAKFEKKTPMFINLKK